MTSYITVRTTGGMKITCASLERAVIICRDYPTAGKLDMSTLRRLTPIKG